jgi:hypothetical protein
MDRGTNYAVRDGNAMAKAIMADLQGAPAAQAATAAQPAVFAPA